MFFNGVDVLQETLCTAKVAETSSSNIGVPGCTSNGSYPGDYSSVLSLVTNTELQPVKALMSYSLVSNFAIQKISEYYCAVESVGLIL
jgi:hypothetical protein